MTDGRNIDSAVGTLTGEGSEQRIAEVPASPALWTQTGHNPIDPSYYDRPVVRKSPWSWDVPAYYFTGGLSGGALTLSAAATLLNAKHLKGLIFKTRWIATVGGAVSSALLIHDLGRPSRFLNMLRVFRPTSPMSVGAWILVFFSSCAGGSAMAQWLLPRRFGIVANALGVMGGLLGLPLAGYTGVLLSNTAIPVWRQPYRLMPVMFMASGVTSATSLLDVLPATRREQRAVAIFGIAGKAVECIAAELTDREVDRIPEVARPLHEGHSGLLWQAGKVLTMTSLALSFLPRPSRRLRQVSGALGMAGALCMRFGIHYAGQASGMNPRATFHQQRART